MVTKTTECVDHVLLHSHLSKNKAVQKTKLNYKKATRSRLRLKWQLDDQYLQNNASERLKTLMVINM
jgi:hypothetical protein